MRKTASARADTAVPAAARADTGRTTGEAPMSAAPTASEPSVGAPSARSQPAPAQTASARPSLYRFIVPLAAFVAIAVVLGIGIMNSRSVGVIRSPLVGKRAPAWSLPVLDQAGRTFGSKDLAGKWYVLNFWGSWCFACKDEHQQLLNISHSSSVPIIGIDWRDDDADARNFLGTLGNPYETVATDHDGRVVVDWGVYGAPESFLVNPQGVVVFKQIGPITPDIWNKEFASRLPAELAAPKS